MYEHGIMQVKRSGFEGSVICMFQRQFGGINTEMKLDVVRDPSKWSPVLDAYLNNAVPLVCPLCKSKKVYVISEYGKDHIGFAFVHCPDCGKGAHFSRVLFPVK